MGLIYLQVLQFKIIIFIHNNSNKTNILHILNGQLEIKR